MSEISSIAACRSIFSFFVSLNLEYSNLHNKHSLHCNIRYVYIFHNAEYWPQIGGFFFFLVYFEGMVSSVSVLSKSSNVVPILTWNWIRQSME